MIKFRNLYFPDGEKILPEHMAAAGDVSVAGAGTYQWRKYARAIPLIKNFNHAVDVGANVGTWAHHLARLFANVTCFEPVKEFVDCLQENIEPADRAHVTIHNCALGAKEGEVGIQIQLASSGWTHVVPTDPKGAAALDKVHDKQYPGRKVDETRMVPVKTLDSFNLPKVDFLKIDVEGFEYFVCVGGKNLIARDRPVIIVEQKPGTAARYGLPQTNAVKYLQGLGAKLAFEWSGDFCMHWV